MADHLTEEEQIESIKRWIKENGMSILLPAVVAVALYGGWEFWKDLKDKRAMNASDQYSLIVDALSTTGGEAASAEKVSEAKTAATSVVNEFDGTMYADMSQLILARIDVDAGDLEQAKTRLQSVIDSGVHEASVSLAKARLAKVKIALKEYDSALSIVSEPQGESYKALYAEIRGDVYQAKGDDGAAHTAYQEALVNLMPSQGSHRGILQLKIDATKDASVETASASVEEAP